MIDLSKIDPATLPAGTELDAWIDIEWMGNPQFVSGGGYVPRHVGKHWHYGPDGEGPFYIGPSYSTNPAHAGEARRKAGRSAAPAGQDHPGGGWIMETLFPPREGTGIVCFIFHGAGRGDGVALFSEVTGDTEEEIEAKTEALATCRAIAAAMVAAEAGRVKQ